MVSIHVWFKFHGHGIEVAVMPATFHEQAAKGMRRACGQSHQSELSCPRDSLSAVIVKSRRQGHELDTKTVSW